MPSHWSVKSLVVESVLCISLFAIAAHLSVNFWERYVIKTELMKMKSSLHTLKDTINNIEVAYDQLHKELKNIANDVDTNGKRNNRLSVFRNSENVEAYDKSIHARPRTEDKNDQKTLMVSDKIFDDIYANIAASNDKLQKSNVLSLTYRNSNNKKVDELDRRSEQRHSPIPYTSSRAMPKNMSTLTQHQLRSFGTNAYHENQVVNDSNHRSEQFRGSSQSQTQHPRNYNYGNNFTTQYLHSNQLIRGF